VTVVRSRVDWATILLACRSTRYYRGSISIIFSDP